MYQVRSQKSAERRQGDQVKSLVRRSMAVQERCISLSLVHHVEVVTLLHAIPHSGLAPYELCPASCRRTPQHSLTRR